MPVVDIQASNTYPLRQKILRPGLSLEACQYPGDSEAKHFAYTVDEQIVAILSVYPEDETGETQQFLSWRIRGVATDEMFRGSGYAGALIQAAEKFVASKGRHDIWCNARVNATTLYFKHGFEVRGDKFNIESIGEHYRMHKSLSGASE